jgi:hypothetical protein
MLPVQLQQADMARRSSRGLSAMAKTMLLLGSALLALCLVAPCEGAALWARAAERDPPCLHCWREGRMP